MHLERVVLAEWHGPVYQKHAFARHKHTLLCRTITPQSPLLLLQRRSLTHQHALLWWWWWWWWLLLWKGWKEVLDALASSSIELLEL
jgi:hypothetical protein